MNKNKTIRPALKTLINYYPKTPPMHKAQQGDPFRTLITVLMSARAKDSITVKIAYELFKIADSPQKIVQMGETKLAEKIKGVNFYKTKAKNIHSLCKKLITDYNGKIPNTEEELVKLPGVGVKTARVFLNQAFKKPLIAVDTHVHRIPNRIGWIQTQKVEETQTELEKIIPKELKTDTNRVIVYHGQNICLPVNPKCNICPILKYCQYGKQMLGKDFKPKVKKNIKLKVG